MGITTPTPRRVREATAEVIVRAAIALGDHPRALATTLAAFGAEIYGFLRAVAARGQDARRTYGRFIETLQRELQSTRLDCEVRVMAYGVARREARRQRETRGQVRDDVHLATDDLELLVLRLDRSFSWRQLARISLGAPGSEPAMLAESDRLRARFLALRRELSIHTKRGST